MPDPAWKQTLDALDAGTITLMIRCPDGVERRIWGVDRQIGAVFISGWEPDAWIDCSTGEFRVEFPAPKNDPR